MLTKRIFGKKALVLYLGLTLHLTNSLAQEVEVRSCGTPSMDSLSFVSQAHYGNNEYLQEVLDANGYRGWESLNNQMARLPDSSLEFLLTYKDSMPFYNYIIPVKVWVYRGDNAEGGASERYVREVFDLVQQNFDRNRTSIKFYIKCDIEYINSDGFYSRIDCSDEFSTFNVFQNHYDPHALNAHFVNSGCHNSGYARFPTERQKFSFWAITSANINQTANLVTHEIGHCFGLLHTHENCRGATMDNREADRCFQESVSRTRKNRVCVFTSGKTKCSINGDALCDTEASVEDLGDHLNNCTTQPSIGSDKWGERWRPQVSNFMSYASLSCLSDFTPQQIAVMWRKIYFHFRQPPELLAMANQLAIPSNMEFTSENTLNEEVKIYAMHEIAGPYNEAPFVIQENTQVSFTTNSSIELMPGFEASPGASFTAEVKEEFDYCRDLANVESYFFDQIHQRVDQNINPEIGGAYNSLHLVSPPPLEMPVVKKVTDKNSQEKLAHSRVHIFPNPTNNEININFLHEIVTSKVKIICLDYLGRVVFEGSKIAEMSSYKIDVSNWKKGVYFIKISDRGTSFLLEKFIIHR